MIFKITLILHFVVLLKISYLTFFQWRSVLLLYNSRHIPSVVVDLLIILSQRHYLIVLNFPDILDRGKEAANVIAAENVSYGSLVSGAVTNSDVLCLL